MWEISVYYLVLPLIRTVCVCPGRLAKSTTRNFNPDLCQWQRFPAAIEPSSLAPPAARPLHPGQDPGQAAAYWVLERAPSDSGPARDDVRRSWASGSAAQRLRSVQPRMGPQMHPTSQHLSLSASAFRWAYRVAASQQSSSQRSAPRPGLEQPPPPRRLPARWRACLRRSCCCHMLRCQSLPTFPPPPSSAAETSFDSTRSLHP